ncbi:MAG: glycosyltransferase [Thermodesulfobacteriota bacterium]
MVRNGTYDILMYSHDTYGLGHIRRTMAIASQLIGPEVNILILTGSPIVGRFSFPEQIDFVRIPGMIKKTNEEYLPLSIKIHPQHALSIRKSIITATARTFRPHLFIVDKEPLGLKREVLPTLHWLKRCFPEARTILGLRDIMDDAATVRQDWEDKKVYSALADLYSEIWVYGNRELYDPIVEYGIPEAVARKMIFTGYIPRKTPENDAVRRLKRDQGVANGERLVVVTTGGGGDGFAVMDTFLAMVEAAAGRLPFTSLLVTGPFMPRQERRDLAVRARRLGVRILPFVRHMEGLLAAAELVVTMGGYNTICEILTQGKPSLIIPRETPRREQLLRAQALKRQGLVDFIPWGECTPATMKEKILRILADPEPFRQAMARFPLTGLDVMRQRLALFRA